jgi:predicted enzyme related to lactoylglutathione lyase
LGGSLHCRPSRRGKIFNWTATEVERSTHSGSHAYVILSNDGRPIAGIAVRPKRLKDEARGRWVGYISVNDVPATLAAATAQGGRIIFPSKNLAERGTQAIFSDPEGALLGLMHSTSGDPGEYTPGAGDWVWAEHFARDPDAALRFDHAVLGYETSRDDRMQQAHTFLLSSGGYARGSVAPLPPKAGAHPAWLLFVRVTDIQTAIGQVTALGGEVRVKPRHIDATTWLAVVRDPVGSAIGLIQLAEPAGGPSEPAPGGQP